MITVDFQERIDGEFQMRSEGTEVIQWNLLITTSWGLGYFGRYWRASLLMGYNYDTFLASYKKY